MQRVHRAFVRHRARGGHQCLTGHQATENTALAGRTRLTAENIVLNALQIQDRQQVPDRIFHNKPLNNRPSGANKESAPP